jgi:hypothetical protein
MQEAWAIHGVYTWRVEFANAGVLLGSSSILQPRHCAPHYLPYWYYTFCCQVTAVCPLKNWAHGPADPCTHGIATRIMNATMCEQCRSLGKILRCLSGHLSRVDNLPLLPAYRRLRNREGAILCCIQ